MKKVTKVDVLSVAYISALTGVFSGLLMGAVVTAGSLFLGGMLESLDGDGLAGGMLVSAAAVIVLPILYGIAGFIGGLISAVLYNLAAKVSGGIKLNLEAENTVEPAPGATAQNVDSPELNL